MLRLTPCQRDECFFWRLSKFVSYSAPTGVSIENKDKRRFGGGIQRGRCPLCVVVGEGYIGEGPHRKGPAPMRFFGYFLSVQKVTRGTGAEPPMVSKRKWNIRGAWRIKISYFVAAGAVEEKFVDKEKKSLGNQEKSVNRRVWKRRGLVHGFPQDRMRQEFSTGRVQNFLGKRWKT